MSKVPLRRPAVLFVLAVLCLIGSCTTIDERVLPPNTCSGTGHGNPDHNSPVVCVDGSGQLQVNPDSVRVWNVHSHDKRRRPVIHWTTKPANQKLFIEMKDDGCVEKPTCNGQGHCSAKVLESIGTELREGVVIKRCAYKVTFNEQVLDPETVVVACCSDH